MNSIVYGVLILIAQVPELEFDPISNLGEPSRAAAPAGQPAPVVPDDDWAASPRPARPKGAPVPNPLDEDPFNNAELNAPVTPGRSSTIRAGDTKTLPVSGGTTVTGRAGSGVDPIAPRLGSGARTTLPVKGTTVPTGGGSQANPDRSAADRVALAAHDATRTAESYLTHATTFVRTQGLSLAMRLLGSLLVYLIGRWVAAILTAILCEVMERARVDPLIVRFARNVIYCALVMFVILGALSVLGVNVESAAAVLAAAGFAVGLALQGSLSNFAAGILLIALKPFKVGDDIEAAGTSGNVEEINIFNTILRSSGNVQVIIPNGQITSGVIRNNTAHATRRIELSIACSYGDDLREVKSMLERILADDRRVLRDPGPLVAVVALAECGVQFTVQGTVKTSDFGRVKSELTERIKLSFDQNGFTIPFPSRDLYVHTANVIPLAKSA